MASLDPEAEARLYDAIRRRLPNTTVVAIEHRPAPASATARHLVLDRKPDEVGRLVEAERLAAE